MRADIINATIKSSFLWPDITQFQLQTNMRMANDNTTQYRDFLIQLGNGQLPKRTIEDNDDYIKLPENIWMPLNMRNLFNQISDDFQNNSHDPEYIDQRAILCPLNTETDEINNFASQQLPGQFRNYLSTDTITDQYHDNNQNYPLEYLNSIDLSGIPKHELKLKINQPIILIRNISNVNGLCNGTRMVVKVMHDYCIEVEFLKGPRKGQREFLPKMKLNPSDNTLPFEFTRKQFPIKVAFTMSINRSQGQTLQKVGVFLPQNVFTHGQLYVALSRVSNSNNIFISSPNIYTRNIVFDEIIYL